MLSQINIENKINLISKNGYKKSERLRNFLLHIQTKETLVKQKLCTSYGFELLKVCLTGNRRKLKSNFMKEEK